MRAVSRVASSVASTAAWWAVQRAVSKAAWRAGATAGRLATYLAAWSVHAMAASWVDWWEKRMVELMAASMDVLLVERMGALSVEQRASSTAESWVVSKAGVTAVRWAVRKGF